MLIMICFYKLHLEYIWHAHPQFFWRPALAFSVVFRKFSEYLVMIKDKHYYILIIVRIVAQMFFYLFILAGYALFFFAPLYCRHPYQSRNHLMNSCLHLSFKSRISYCNYVKSHILWCFQNQQFSQWVVGCNF